MPHYNLCTKKQSKRGRIYNTRSTKLANGFSKSNADNGVSPKGDLLTLAVRGTLDPLAREKFRVKWFVVHHPQDSSYTKRVVRLNDNGRKKLRFARIRKQKRLDAKRLRDWSVW